MKRHQPNVEPATPNHPRTEHDSVVDDEFDDARDDVTDSLDPSDQSWDAFLVDDDELDPDPEPGDFWFEDD